MDGYKYEKCRLCWHFIEPDDADNMPGLAAARYVHLDSGEKDHDHDAMPSGDVRSLAQWRTDYPELFEEHEDGHIGPNSAYFKAPKQ